jgi:hypothetical protein
MAYSIPQITIMSVEETRIVAYNGSDASIGQLYKGKQERPFYGVWLDDF